MTKRRKPKGFAGVNYDVRPRPTPRKDGTWPLQARVYNPATKKRDITKTFDTPEAAVIWCQQQLGIRSDGPSLTVGAVQRRWLDHKATEGHTMTSVRRASERTDAFAAVYGNEPIRTITRSIAQDWIDQHRSHYADLQAMFNWAADHLDAIPASPFKGKRPVAKSKMNPDLARRALTETELHSLAAYAGRRHGTWHETLILWLGYGGQRLNEGLDTRVDCLEGLMPGGNLRVRVETQYRSEEGCSRHTKGKKTGSIIIPGWVAEAAAPLIEDARQRDDGLIFVTPKGNRLQYQNYLTGYWYQVREGWTATLPDMHWLRRRLAADPRRGLTAHELRHTSSTIIATLTGDLNASRAQLRHSKQTMTVGYTHPEDELGLAAVDAGFASGQVIPIRRGSTA